MYVTEENVRKLFKHLAFAEHVQWVMHRLGYDIFLEYERTRRKWAQGLLTREELMDKTVKLAVRELMKVAKVHEPLSFGRFSDD